MKNRLTEQEFKKIKAEAYAQSLFSRDECRGAVLNAARYLEKNGPTGTFSESAVHMLSNIALAFAAGELDWVKDIGREEE
jgi:hypothetical protein